jgi:pilus assembly protein CpaE
MRGLSIVTASPGGRFDAALEASAEVDVRARVERLDDLAEVITAKHPDALLVSLETTPQAVFDALDKLLAPKPLLLFHGPADSRLILQAMRSGAYEYIAPGSDEEEQLLATIRRAAREAAGSSALGQAALVVLLGAKGGVGTSFTACQLGAMLAREGARTALVDGHFRHGDVALYLDLSPRYSFSSLATRSEPIDITYLHTTLVSHSSKVAVLAAPKHPEEADAITAGCVDGVVELLRGEFDWVVWDAPREFDDRNLHVLDQADAIALVTTPDVAAMSHTRVQIELLRRLGHDERNVRIVLNRTGSGASVSKRDVNEFLKRPLDASIPNDYRRAAACVNEGRTILEMAPRSALGTAFGELAGHACDWCNRSVPDRPRRGLFARLRGK